MPKFDADDVWSLDDLIPKKKYVPRRQSDSTTATVVFGEDTEKKEEKIPSNGRLEAAKAALAAAEKKANIVRPSAETASREVKSFSPLITKITVSPVATERFFHERFRTDAVRYSKAKGKECDYVPFFSYSPLYSQMNAGQLSYYLYWRDCARGGNFIRADYSYILLFVTETVNLSDRSEDKDGDLTLLCRIWKEYRHDFTLIDKLLPIWITDFCIICGLEPSDEAKKIISMMTVSAHPDVSAFTSGFGQHPKASLIVSTAVSHSWKESKLVTDENRVLFEAHVLPSAVIALSNAEKKNAYPFGDEYHPCFREETKVRTSFSGITCPSEFRYSITTAYYSVSRSPDLRNSMNELVKYSENNVRKLFGIRSRYHLYSLPASLRSEVDSYFAPLIAATHKEPEKVQERPEYEKLYDAKVEEISLGRAENIEKEAWKTTALLTDNEDFAVEEYVEEKVETKDDGGMGDISRRVIASLLGKSGEKLELIANECHCLPDALADNVNEMLFDVFGDSVIENDGHFFIGFYRSEAEKWLEGSEG